MKYLTKEELYKELNNARWMEMAGCLDKLIYYFIKYKELQKTIDFERLKWDYLTFDLELRKIIISKYEYRKLQRELKQKEEPIKKKVSKI